MMISAILDVDTEHAELDVTELCAVLAEQGVISVTTHQGITFDVQILELERIVEFIDDLD